MVLTCAHDARRWAWAHHLASTAASWQGSRASVWTASRSSESQHTHMRICDTGTRCLSGGPARAARVSDRIRVWCRVIRRARLEKLSFNDTGACASGYAGRHEVHAHHILIGECCSPLRVRHAFRCSASDFRDGDVDRACTRSRRSATICQAGGKHRSRPWLFQQRHRKERWHRWANRTRLRDQQRTCLCPRILVEWAMRTPRMVRAHPGVCNQ